MNRYYEDLLSRINEEPVWFDEHAVPRFCPFEPGKAANIYAEEVVLTEIACQNCARRFLVAFSRSQMDAISFIKDQARFRWLADEIKKRSLHYGDPPNMHCCASGPSMNSEMLRVVEYWRRNKHFEWVRNPQLEFEFDNDDE